MLGTGLLQTPTDLSRRQFLFPVRRMDDAGFPPEQFTKSLNWLFRKTNRLLLKKKIPSIIRSKRRGANSMVEVRSAFKTLKVRNPRKSLSCGPLSRPETFLVSSLGQLATPGCEATCVTFWFPFKLFCFFT